MSTTKDVHQKLKRAHYWHTDTGDSEMIKNKSLLWTTFKLFELLNKEPECRKHRRDLMQKTTIYCKNL